MSNEVSTVDRALAIVNPPTKPGKFVAGLIQVGGLTVFAYLTKEKWGNRAAVYGAATLLVIRSGVELYTNSRRAEANRRAQEQTVRVVRRVIEPVVNNEHAQREAELSRLQREVEAVDQPTRQRANALHEQIKSEQREVTQLETELASLASAGNIEEEIASLQRENSEKRTSKIFSKNKLSKARKEPGNCSAQIQQALKEEVEKEKQLQETKILDLQDQLNKLPNLIKIETDCKGFLAQAKEVREQKEEADKATVSAQTKAAVTAQQKETTGADYQELKKLMEQDANAVQAHVKLHPVSSVTAPKGFLSALTIFTGPQAANLTARILGFNGGQE